jgi:replicative DNA helicase
MDLSNLNKDKKNRRQQPVDMSTMVYGKIPPQAKELEGAVLGAIMLERNAFDMVADILKPECFYMDAHQRIFRAAMVLSLKGQPIDIFTMVEELKTSEELDIVGGAYFVTKLTDSVVSAAHIETHALIIKQKAMARMLIAAGGQMIQDAYEDSKDVFDMVDAAEASISAITQSSERGKILSISTVAVRGLQRLEELRAQDSAITGIPSGFAHLDDITHGWQSTDLIILAARPAVGKTAFAINLARNAGMHSKKPIPVAFFSLEMSAGQIFERILTAESEVLFEKIKTGRLEEQEMKRIHQASGRIAAAPMYVDDTPALNIFELRAKCRRLKRKHNIGFIIIDYLQLMSGVGDNRNGNREQEISQISRALKALAKEIQVPIIALSQLSRGVESRQDKTPQLSDLRESGAIEQDADMVMFLYRPEYYGITANEMGESNKGETHVKIAKHRNGSLDTVKLRALLHIQKFVEMDQSETPPPAKGTSWRPVGDIRQPYKDDDAPF